MDATRLAMRECPVNEGCLASDNSSRRLANGSVTASTAVTTADNTKVSFIGQLLIRYCLFTPLL